MFNLEDERDPLQFAIEVFICASLVATLTTELLAIIGSKDRVNQYIRRHKMGGTAQDEQEPIYKEPLIYSFCRDVARGVDVTVKTCCRRKAQKPKLN